MKFSVAFALLVIVGFVAIGDALPARKNRQYFVPGMVYYQQPAAAEWYGAGSGVGPQQRIMYMQYVQPGRTHARSTQAASALVAGESVATGTYLKESDVAVSVDDSSAEGAQADDVLSAAGAQGATSVAEAYPDEAPVVQVAVDNAAESEAEVEAEVPAAVENDDAAKVPRDFNFAAEEAAAAPVETEAEEPAAVPAVEQAAEEELPAPAPIAPVAPVVPAKRVLPAQKKKVIVELDQSADDVEEAQVAAIEDEEAENAVADDVEEDDEDVVEPVKPVVVKRRPAARRPAARQPAPAKPAKKPLPAGTFFPIDFGGTNGGAIAIANSFSTGEGGSATSHAIAYGSPDAARARVRPNPSKRRH
ncbi:translation initiation factor IF-2 isoform X2 [Drosophila albomicans]|uniref:Translation initiation factor IF-2 isoform X2 n=1 Tax=Drosophila albomicans TaxID=7291 RepID=A0A9C6WE49_DROAB|nr:translation initiation factor IF-2 isoform X2 [Drosophila albomicans]